MNVIAIKHDTISKMLPDQNDKYTFNLNGQKVQVVNTYLMDCKIQSI